MAIRLRNIIRKARDLAIGSTLAQIITVLSAPVITRIFSPEVFGTVATVVAFCTLVGAVSSLCYENALFLSEDRKESRHILALCVTLSFFISVVAFFLYPLVGQISSNRGLTDPSITFFVPALIFTIGVSTPLMVWLLTSDKHKIVVFTDIFNAGSQAATKIGMGLSIAASNSSLLTGTLVGHLSKIVIFFVHLRSRWHLVFTGVTKIQVGTLISVSREYREFPLFQTPSRFLRSSAVRLPIFILGIYYSPSMVAFYALSHRLIVRSGQPFFRAIKRAFLSEISKKKNAHKGILRAFLIVMLLILVIGAIPMGAIMIWGNEIFSFILGENWAQSGDFARYMAPWLLSQFLVAPSSAIFIIYRLQKRWMFLQLASAAIRLCALMTGVFLDLDVESLILLFAFVSILVNLMIIFQGYIACRFRAQGAIE